MSDTDTDTDNGTDAETTDQLRYTIQYREPKGYGGQWRNATKYVTCDHVEATGDVVRFIDDGADTFAVKQEHLINYERW